MDYDESSEDEHAAAAAPMMADPSDYMPGVSAMIGGGGEGLGAMDTDGDRDVGRGGSTSDSDDDGEEVNRAAAVEPRGKTFPGTGKVFPPPFGGASDEEDGHQYSDADDGEYESPAAAAHDPAPTIHQPPAPAPSPRGKELRLLHTMPLVHQADVQGKTEDNDASSSDDEPLASRGTRTRKRKARAKAKVAAAATVARKKSPTKKKKKATPKKRKAAPAPAPSDDDHSDDDSDGEGAVAFVVADDDDDAEEVAVAENISTPARKRQKANDGGPAGKKKGGKKAAPKGKGGSKKSASSKGGRKSSAGAAGYADASRLEAAASARSELRSAVARLPCAVSDTHTVRDFGTVRREAGGVGGPGHQACLYAVPDALYPVGFSCDRTEYSPVHGRSVRMRCDILDGAALRERRERLERQRLEKQQLKQQQGEGDEGSSNGKDDDSEGAKEEGNDEDGSSLPPLVEERRYADVDRLGDGPVFRVTWGEGLDADCAGGQTTCPFDPYVLSGEAETPRPEAGTRVSVKFDDSGEVHGGVIMEVNDHVPDENASKKAAGNKASTRSAAPRPPLCDVTILYDSGTFETAAYPDPDITLASGCPPVDAPDGVIKSMAGLPVTCVLASSPIEAWGKALIAHGLIDEVMYDAALTNLAVAKDERMREVQTRMDEASRKRKDGYTKSKHHNRRRTERRLARLRSENGEDGEPIPDEAASEGPGGIKSEGSMDGDDGVVPEEVPSYLLDPNREPPTADEVVLLEKFEEVRGRLEESRRRAREAAAELSTARIECATPFASNPFAVGSDAKAAKWLSDVVKKERGSMPNHGNKKKVATPTMLLERADTFYDAKVEKLVEGLPGTEGAASYVFHGHRGQVASQPSWVAEANIKHQKEVRKKKEKAMKAAKQAEMKAIAEREK